MHVDLAWFPALPAALQNRTVAFENTALLKNKLEQSRLGFQREWKDLDPCCFASSAPQSVIGCKLAHIMKKWRVFSVITVWKSGICEIMKKPRVCLHRQTGALLMLLLKWLNSSGAIEAYLDFLFFTGNTEFNHGLLQEQSEFVSHNLSWNWFIL